MSPAEDEKVVRLVNTAAKLLQPDGSVPHGALLRFQQLVYLLSYYRGISFYRDGTPEKQQFVCRVLKSLLGNDGITKEQFDEAIERESQRVAERQTRDFQVVFSINLDETAAELFEPALGISASDSPSELLDSTRAQKAYNIYGDAPGGLPTDYRENRARYTYCVINASSATIHEGMESAVEEFDVARAWVNFALGMFSVKLESDRQQLSLVSPSYLVNCYDSEYKLVAQRNIMDNYSHLIPVVRDGELARAKHFLESVESHPRGALADRLQSAMALYGEALDQFNQANQFFCLWQSLEILLGTGEQDEMRCRMKTLLPDVDLSAVLIDPLFEKRNKLIYHGRIRQFSDEDTSILRNLVDSSLVSILALTEKLQSNEQLEDFWGFRGLDDEELKQKRAVLDQILSTPRYEA